MPSKSKTLKTTKSARYVTVAVAKSWSSKTWAKGKMFYSPCGMALLTSRTSIANHLALDIVLYYRANRIMTLPPVVWPSPPQNLALADDEVHVWRALLDMDSQIIESLKTTLVPHEQSRASRFIFTRDQNHFVACRGFCAISLACTYTIRRLDLSLHLGPMESPTSTRIRRHHFTSTYLTLMVWQYTHFPVNVRLVSILS